MIIGFGVGIYIVIVIDVNECEVMVMVIIEEVFEFDINVDVFEVVCGVGNIGEVFVEVIGGLLFYIYEWSIGEFDINIENFFEGIYFVMVMDVNGCMKVEEIFIEVIEDFFIIVVLRDVFCNGDNIGSILVIVEGGIVFYLYEWFIGDMFSELINLLVG